MNALIEKERGKDVIVVVEITKIVPRQMTLADENSTVIKNVADMTEVMNFTPLLERIYSDMAI